MARIGSAEKLGKVNYFLDPTLDEIIPRASIDTKIFPVCEYQCKLAHVEHKPTVFQKLSAEDICLDMFAGCCSWKMLH